MTCMRSHSFLITLRRGFSILELLAVMAIMVVIGAIVVPWGMGWLGGRELDAAEESIAMQLMMARAAAREEGRPVEVISTGAGTVHARWMSDGVDESDEGDDAGLSSASAEQNASSPSRAQSDRGETQLFSSEAGGGDSELSIVEAWARFDLPPGVSIARTGDELDSAEGAELKSDELDGVGTRAGATKMRAATNATDDKSTDESTSAPQTLAIFLPDGTAIVAPIFMLRTDAGLARTLKVDRTTGRPRAVAAPVVSDNTTRKEFDVEREPVRGASSPKTESPSASGSARPTR